MLFLISLLTLSLSIGASLSSCKLLKDPIEMLNCQVKYLVKSNHQLELSVDEGKASVDIQNKLLLKMSKVTDGLSSRCNQDLCGSCACYTDYQLSKNYYCNCEHIEPMRDCLAFRNDGYNISGLYMIHMKNIKTIEVFCDQETDGGGWTVFQRRLNGRTNFYRDWVSYKDGFGNPQREFWLGNDNIYLLTYQAEYPTGSELRIDMEEWSHKKFFAKYRKFSIDNEEQKYQLHVSGFLGNIGDGLSYHRGRKFTTYDNDNDAFSRNRNCARSNGGAWWYGACHHSNLNGKYKLFGENSGSAGVSWYHRGKPLYMKSVEMKVRRNA